MVRSLSLSQLSELSDFVASAVGLHYPAERWADLERGLTSAGRELGHAALDPFARYLLGSSPTRSQIEVLASHLTVGETYFFREAESLRQLEGKIVPELLQSRAAGDRRLRIWSAGCCTGEEPYSIAMILDRIVPDAPSWNITILATDVNRRFLQKAAEGAYGEWSFRGTPDAIRERYFRRTGHKVWELCPEIRRRVTLSCLNLATDPYPSLVNGTNAMDVIFCRNVLMYFSDERARQVVARFHQALVPGGWLIVGATEPSPATFACFSAIATPGGTLYRKSAEERVASIAMDGGAASFSPPNEVRPAKDYPSTSIAMSDGQRHTVAQPDNVSRASSAEFVARARQCANEGKLAEAEQWCIRAIAADKMAPVHHYLHSVIQREMGQDDAAIQSLTRALYLQPDFVLAHFGLATIELARGHRDDGKRHLVNALEALRNHPHDEILPESDGLMAGRLTEIIGSLLAALPRDRRSVRSRKAR
jgi:chemotaxis protein methyltransferase CheR